MAQAENELVASQTTERVALDQPAPDLAQEIAVAQDLRPVTQLSSPEIVAEARDLHAHFQQLSER